MSGDDFQLESLFIILSDIIEFTEEHCKWDQFFYLLSRQLIGRISLGNGVHRSVNMRIRIAIHNTMMLD